MNLDRVTITGADNSVGAPRCCVMDVTFISLFAGIEGFGAGLEEAGMRCVLQVEKDPNCLRVLAHHWPDVPKVDDVRKVNAKSVPVRPRLVCGGSPCQDLSVAGRRTGLAGERSGLFFEFARIVYELAPEWVLFENVLGLFSSNGGLDFAAVLEAFTGQSYQVPAEGWRNWGIATGPLYGVAWRVLDAQWFGVPQRRRRVFLVGCLGDWRRASEVLFERDCVPWDSPPRQKTRAGTAPSVTPGARRTSGNRGSEQLTAGTLGTTGNGRGWNDDLDRDQNIVFQQAEATVYRTSPNCGAWETGDRTDALTTGTDRTSHVVTHTHTQDLAHAVSRKTGDGQRGADIPPVSVQDVHEGKGIPATVSDRDLARSGQGSGETGLLDVCGPLMAHEKRHGHAMGTQQAAEQNQLVTHTITSAGHDASEDGTGRGTPLVLCQNGSDIQVSDKPGAITTGIAKQTSGDLVAVDAHDHKIRVCLRDTFTGRKVNDDQNTIWWWTEGNGSCDCNRAPMFGDQNVNDDTCDGCVRYQVVSVVPMPPGYALEEFNAGYPMICQRCWGLRTIHDEDRGIDGPCDECKDLPRPEQGAAVAFNIIGTAQEGSNHAYETDISGALQHKGLKPTGNEAGTVIAFQRKYFSDRLNQGGRPSETSPTITSANAERSDNEISVLAFQERGRDGGRSAETQEDLAYSLNAPAGGGRRQELNINAGMMVRRLTPVECCRLQGFSDTWLDIEPPLSDSAKYRLLGNAVCRNVAEWIGKRIRMVMEATA